MIRFTLSFTDSIDSRVYETLIYENPDIATVLEEPVVLFTRWLDTGQYSPIILENNIESTNSRIPDCHCDTVTFKFCNNNNNVLYLNISVYKRIRIIRNGFIRLTMYSNRKEFNPITRNIEFTNGITEESSILISSIVNGTISYAFENNEYLDPNVIIERAFNIHLEYIE